MDLNKPSFAGSYAQRAPMPMPSKPPLPSKPPMPFGAMGNPRGTVEEEPEDEMMPFGMMTGMRGQMQAPSLQRYYDYPSRQPPLPLVPLEAPYVDHAGDVAHAGDVDHAGSVANGTNGSAAGTKCCWYNVYF